jgi:hypothetical protein
MVTTATFLRLPKSADVTALPIWKLVQAGFASAERCKDDAYLIANEGVTGEYRNWMLNTPTTVDRVRTIVPIKVTGLSGVCTVATRTRGQHREPCCHPKFELHSPGFPLRSEVGPPNHRTIQ